MVQLNLIQATVCGWKKRSQNCLNSEYSSIHVHDHNLLEVYTFGSQTVFGKWSFSLDLCLDFIMEKLPCTVQAPVVQTLDSTIHLINLCSVDNEIGFLILIHWIVIYPVDSTIQRLNNPGLDYSSSILIIYCNFEPIGYKCPQQ